MFAGNFAPKGYALCNGQILSIAQNQALFALIGTFYGGNGTQNFGLPNLQSRTPAHVGPSLFPTQGTMNGAETVTLASNQMPQHNHQLYGVAVAGDAQHPNNFLYANVANSYNHYAAPGTLQPLAPDSLQTVGIGQAHQNIQPYLSITFCIALQGVFPTRN